MHDAHTHVRAVVVEVVVNWHAENSAHCLLAQEWMDGGETEGFGIGELVAALSESLYPMYCSQ